MTLDQVFELEDKHTATVGYGGVAGILGDIEEDEIDEIGSADLTQVVKV